MIKKRESTRDLSSKRQFRRTVLKTVPGIAALGVAGCLGGIGGGGDEPDVPDSDNDGTSDDRDDYPNDPDRDFQLSSTTDKVTIPEQYYVPYEFSLDYEDPVVIEYEFRVIDGPAIDVFAMNDFDFQFYKDGKQFEYFDELSILDSSRATVSGETSARTYYQVFDNTGAGKAPRSDVAEDKAVVDLAIETSL